MRYDGEAIRLQPSKTGARVVIPVGRPLKEALDACRRKTGSILVNSRGEGWHASGFPTVWKRAQTAAGIVGVTSDDLRGTAVTRLALAGGTEAEIATITGNGFRDLRSILDAHYLHRDPELGKSTVGKLEGRTKSPDQTPTASVRSCSEMGKA